MEWADLLPSLAEAAGGAVLEEAVLDGALEAELGRAGVKLEPEAIEAERDQLGRSLAAAAKLPEAEGETLVQRIRVSRGLGEARFPALLKRNAMLRALVQSGRVAEGPVRVSEEDLRQAYALKYGPKVRVRLIVVRTDAAATEVIRRVRPDFGPGESFGEVATQLSIDPTTVRGGLMDPFSLDDAAYPVAIRRVISQMEPGQISDPILIDSGDGAAPGSKVQGYAVVKLEERVPPPDGTPTAEKAASSLRAEVQLVRERAAMDRLARRLVQGARVTIFDRSLDRSWQQRTGNGEGRP